MINDIIVEAMDMMIDMCSDKQQAIGMLSLREMLCDFAEDDFAPMSQEEKYEFIKQHLSCEANELD